VTQDRAHAVPGKGFRNPWPGAAPHGFGEFLRWALSERRQRPRRPDPPASSFPRTTPSFPTPRAAHDAIVATWIGHSSFLLQIGGMNVLLDPVWSERASPVSFAGPRRHTAPGFPIDALPPVDIVLLSHDHYDHLDEPTVKQLLRAHPESRWVAPLRVGRWLARRGANVAAELDWWERADVDTLEITATPAQHFSGRSLTGRNSTLWAGWSIRVRDDDASSSGRTPAVFVAGDTGAHPEFGAIARALGPFDAAFLPIGAYDPRWFMRPVHMDPEDAVAAYEDISGENGERALTFVAMHWGTCRLTDEPLDEPPRRARAVWERAGLDPALLWIPAFGESRELRDPRAISG
jgi:N-acyl-phosphatidylethanolamine-hydrolysing phospholipase D